jgi:MSHA biogenesis protein MshI
MARNLRLFAWPWGKNKADGWLAVSAHESEVAYAHAVPRQSGRPFIPTSGLDSGERALETVARKVGASHFRCTTVLTPGEYQLFLVDAPNVPQEELASAVRWKVKDMIDYPVDQATLDVLPVPPEGPEAGRPRFLYAAVARNDVVRERMDRFGKARIPLSVIEVPDTAQRNLSALYEEGERALGVLYLSEEWGLLTITAQGELYLSRRFDVGLRQVAQEAEGEAREGLDRLALELQRTFDHFGRQFRSKTVERLLVAPAPGVDALAAALAERLGLPASVMRLADAIEFEPQAPPIEDQWKLFHHYGAALRQVGP